MHQVKSLLTKELILEWRSRYALNGILLYVVSTIFVCYLSFKGGIQGPTWNVLFWIILLFASINAMVKSFVQEPVGRHVYLYTLASPQAIILSKIIYNCLLMLLLSSLVVTSNFFVDVPTLLVRYFTLNFFKFKRIQLERNKHGNVFKGSCHSFDQRLQCIDYQD